MLILSCVLLLCPERFHWQACALKLVGLLVKSRRPAKFTPATRRCGRGGMVYVKYRWVVLKTVNIVILFVHPAQESVKAFL